MSTENTREQIPEARYVGRARPQLSVTNNKSNDGLRVAVTVDLLNEGYEDRRVVWFGTLGVSNEADDITIRQLRDMGWSATQLDDATGLGDVDVAVVVKYEEYQGKDQMKVSVWPMGGSTFTFEKSADAGLLKSVTAKLKGKLAASVPKRRPAAGPGQAAPAWKAPAPAKGGPAAPPVAPAQGSSDWDGQGAEPPF